MPLPWLPLMTVSKSGSVEPIVLPVRAGAEVARRLRRCRGPRAGDVGADVAVAHVMLLAVADDRHAVAAVGGDRVLRNDVERRLRTADDDVVALPPISTPLSPLPIGTTPLVFRPMMLPAIRTPVAVAGNLDAVVAVAR